MPKETNLNVSPYFDDFDPEKQYYQVLFKPGLPVQARELTSLQSVLQNQIEQLGNHLFKEGSVVIPGQINYNNSLFAVEVESEYLGIPFASYASELLGKVIRGENSNVSAKVVLIIGPEFSERGYHTIYINYLSSGTDERQAFANGETLLLEENLVLNNLNFQSGQGFAITAPTDCTSTGSALFLSEGIYFLRGSFVKVDEQVLILEPHANNPSYRVGFEILEEVITSSQDQSLNDNAKGFNNYAAPGADRLKITASLTKKPLDSEKNENFIEFLIVRNGTVSHINETPEYNVIVDELARRTYDQSGDFYVKPFSIVSRESLNDSKGNNGIFNSNQLTYGNLTPNSSLGVYKISPGKAFIKGYEVNVRGVTFLDFEKTRTTKTLENQKINFITGPTLTLNRVFGAPTIGFTTDNTISLRDQRIGVAHSIFAGKEIGVARVYDYALESGSYSSFDQNLNEWDIALYDIQTYTEITLNEPLTLTAPTFIEGKSSGATAYLRYNTTSGIITAYNGQGKFIYGEKLIFNGIEGNRVSTAITAYSIDDVKSLYSLVGSGITFNADVKPQLKLSYGQVRISPKSGAAPGICTVTSNDLVFLNAVKPGDLVSFTNPAINNAQLKTFAKIVSVTDDFNIIISGITTVSNICDGGLPTSQITPVDFSILKSKFQSSSDNTLYTPLPKKWISNVNLTNSNLTIRKEFDVTITANTTNTIQADEDEFFLPFDEERYVLVNSSGYIEPLTPDKFRYTNGNREIRIFGVNSVGSARLIATLEKINIKNKVKNISRVNSIIVNKSNLAQSGIGSTTLNDGLSYGNYGYGLRVQDKELCLLVPDVTKVYGIFESSDTTDPKLPRISLFNLNGPTGRVDDLIIGEEFIGRESGAVGIFVNKVDSLNLEFIYLNELRLKLNETIEFKETSIRGVVNGFVEGDSNITNRYLLDSGQKETICDYSKLIRITNNKEPKRKLRIIFEASQYSSSDSGDLTTASSYDQINYCDLPLINDSTRLTDILDIRPRVLPFNPESSVSPFEFFGRTFSEENNSSKNIIASDESITLTYSFYLPRIDKIYLNKNRRFQLINGIPSENPLPPIPIDDSLEVATINLPPYICNANSLDISLKQHKRYRMQDVAQLEDRIKNLEYYTALSLLETNTENLFVPDENGLSRFKSGIFVDNFSTRNSQVKVGPVKNSIDPANLELRPSPFTTEIDLQIGSKSLIGIGTTASPIADTKFVNDLVGNNVRRTGQLITLDYDEVVEIKQPFATRVENVVPYLVISYKGTIELFPSSDIWIDQVRLEPQRLELDLYTESREELIHSGFDPQTGLTPVTWDAWEATWTGSTTSVQNSAVFAGSTSNQIGRTITTTNTFRNIQTTTVTRTGTETRSGSQLRLAEQVDVVNEGDRVVSTSVIPFMRSRNVEFTGKSFRPFTRLYTFFDGVDVNRFVLPKLIEIEMITGKFNVGEIITGRMSTGTETEINDSTPFITFRVAKSNHKYGPISNPTDTFTVSPYNQSYTIPEEYSSSSILLNVDTASLSDITQGLYRGFIQTGMRLRGEEGEAVITNVRLFTDHVGTLIGSFFIPNPNIISNPSFETGIKLFKLTSSSTNSSVGGLVSTDGEEQYFAQGTINNQQETIRTTRKPRFDEETVSESRAAVDVQSTTAVSTFTTVSTITLPPPPPPDPPWGGDPLGQSFFITNNTGVFVTAVDVFFNTKDETLPVTVQLRPVVNGVPSTEVYPFGEVVVESKDVVTSSDGSLPTKVLFPSPIYLNPNSENAIVLLAQSYEYTVWISRMGEIDIGTLSQPESRQVLVSAQPMLGSLFKSQNGSTWTPSQYEDLKFNLYSARFKGSNGSITFYNPELSEGNAQIATLLKDSLEFNAKKIIVTLNDTVDLSGVDLGNTIIQMNNNAFANYVGAGGSASGNLNIVNPGIGYTPSNGSSFTFTNVPLVSSTGTGKNATANITIGTANGLNGVAIAATISNGGSGYQIGDVLTVEQIGSETLGRNLQLSLSNISGTNELILDQVQGEFKINGAMPIQYVDSVAGITTILTTSGPNAVITDLELYSLETDGLHIKVNHKNHGMHSEINKVQINHVDTDITPTILTADYTNSDTGSISIASTTSFTTFENVSVASTNPGYVLIDNEIISYTGVGDGQLIGITRQIDQTRSYNYPTGSIVKKYELNGVSLRRINKTHDLQDSLVQRPIGLDYYYIKLDTSSNGTDRNSGNGFEKLYINESKSSGGNSVKASQNIQYEIARPIVQTLVLSETNIRSSIKTVTGTSIDGDEVSFIESEILPLNITENTFFDTPRIVASKVNETDKLSSLPGNKSLSVTFNLSTLNNTVSPVIDLDRVGLILTTNRVNNVIDDYVNDSRTSSIYEDPTAFIYTNKLISLENSASSIKILLSAYVNVFSEVRAFYTISNKLETNPIYYPFPGYNNLDVNGKVIDIFNSDGLPNKLVPKTDVLGFGNNEVTFRDYEFFIDNLPEFRYFGIKLIGTSTNQAHPPRIKDLRVIALA